MLEIALAILAVVSAVVAFMSYKKADESNKIATRAIDEQLRPQLILYCNKRINDIQVLVKNIGNASAMNIKVVVNMPPESTLYKNADIGEPSSLATGEEKILYVWPSDPDLEPQVQRQRNNLASLLVSESSNNEDQHTITIEYNDISSTKLYTTTFLTQVEGFKHIRTTTKEVSKK